MACRQMASAPMTTRTTTARERLGPVDVTAHPLDTRQDIEQSFAIRYQVFCEERGIFPTRSAGERYEKDDFDEVSHHLGAKDLTGKTIGTVRLVRPSEQGFPLDHYAKDCIPAHIRETAGEVSRLAVPLAHARLSGKIALELYLGIYRLARRLGLSHVFAAMESSLARLLARLHIPFKGFGPEVDYFGPVRTYVLSLDELEVALYNNNRALYDRLFEDPRIPAYRTDAVTPFAFANATLAP